jgi:adenylate cyclase
MPVDADRKALFRRTGTRIGFVCSFANFDAALFVFVFLEFIAPAERPKNGNSLTIDIVAFAVFMTAALVIGTWFGKRLVVHRLGWIERDEPPTDDERAATLRLPFELAAPGVVVWVVAGVFFGALAGAAGHTWGWIAEMFGTTLLGGIVSAAVAFLMLERVCRPVFALALAGNAPERAYTMGVRPRLLLTWLLGSAVPLLGLAFLPFDAQHADYRTNIAGAVVALSIIGLVLGFLTTMIAAMSLADPLAEVRGALARVQGGDLSVEVAVDDGGEVGLLQSGVNAMVAGLRERQRLADLFGKHVGTEVAKQAIEQGTGIESEQREASALFVDLVGSTALAEVLPPSDVVQTLNAFFDAVVRVVSAEGGWVNKFEGDGALCVFGTPATQPDHAARALRSARVLHQELQALVPAYPGLDAAIGVSSGVVVAGNVGTETRYEYTVIGAPVNEAARLTDLAKGQPGRVLAGEGAIERAGDEAVRWASLGTVALRGKAAPVSIFEPVEVRARV